MADIAPLTPLRYAPSIDLASVVAPPYDVIDEGQKKALQDRDPHNVVRLILPDGDGDAKYANAAATLAAWREGDALIRDDEPAFHVYEQSFAPPGGGARITRRGFLGLVRLAPYEDKIVLPHERTLSGPKEDRLKLFRATRTNLSPGFMLYRDPAGVVARALSGGLEIARFTTRDGVEQRVCKVSDPVAIRAAIAHVKTSQLLIADGHHRYETALRYSGEMSSSPGAVADGRHRFFMVFFACSDDPDLVVFATHRHVHSVADFAWERVAPGLAALFDVRELASGHDASSALAALAASGREVPSFVLGRPDGSAFLVSLRPGVDLASHPVLGEVPPALRRTDVAILHGAILETVLGITREAQAAKANIWYPQDAAAALADLRSGKGQALFLMNATPVSQVREVAEAGLVMPQKSTFFYPKVLTGLTIHTLEPDVPVSVP